MATYNSVALSPPGIAMSPQGYVPPAPPSQNLVSVPPPKAPELVSVPSGNVVFG